MKRDDLYGKTGTTNDSLDTWFAGFQPTMVGVAWIGYDTPRRLGVRGETGGSLSLPVWTDYMRTALQGVPVTEPTPPEGVVQVDGTWYFDDYAPGRGIASLGEANGNMPPAEVARRTGDRIDADGRGAKEHPRHVPLNVYRAASGNASVASAPPPLALTSSMRPRCSAAISFTKARPSPVLLRLLCGRASE